MADPVAIAALLASAVLLLKHYCNVTLLDDPRFSPVIVAAWMVCLSIVWNATP